jgi:hypothetical protein
MEIFALFFSPENMKGRDPLGDLVIGGRIIIKWIFKK